MRGREAENEEESCHTHKNNTTRLHPRHEHCLATCHERRERMEEAPKKKLCSDKVTEAIKTLLHICTPCARTFHQQRYPNDHDGWQRAPDCSLQQTVDSCVPVVALIRKSSFGISSHCGLHLRLRVRVSHQVSRVKYGCALSCTTFSQRVSWRIAHLSFG